MENFSKSLKIYLLDSIFEMSNNERCLASVTNVLKQEKHKSCSRIAQSCWVSGFSWPTAGHV